MAKLLSEICYSNVPRFCCHKAGSGLNELALLELFTSQIVGEVLGKTLIHIGKTQIVPETIASLDMNDPL